MDVYSCFCGDQNPSVFHGKSGHLHPRSWPGKQLFSAGPRCPPHPNQMSQHKHSVVTREKQTIQPNQTEAYQKLSSLSHHLFGSSLNPQIHQHVQWGRVYLDMALRGQIKCMQLSCFCPPARWRLDIQHDRPSLLWVSTDAEP